MRELRNKRFEPEGSEKYKEVNNIIKKCMKRATENWIGEQCSEIEENLRKNNRGQSNWWKTWPLWNRGKRLLSKIIQENASQKSDRYWTNEQNTAHSYTTTRPVEIHHVLNCPQTDTEDHHPILCREVEGAVQSLKKGKSAGVNNIPAELVQAGEEKVITALMTSLQ